MTLQKNISPIISGFVVNLFLGFGLWSLLITGLGYMIFPIIIALILTGCFFGVFWGNTSLSFWQKSLLAWLSIALNHFMFFRLISGRLEGSLYIDFYMIFMYLPFLIIGIALIKLTEPRTQ